MKEEKTLYDIVTRLEGIISDLNDWSESEALNVESLQRQLYKVKKKIAILTNIKILWWNKSVAV